MGRGAGSGTVAGMTWVTAGAMTANVLSYLLYLVAGRWLLPEGYGLFASLITAQMVLAVPALALQAVIARAIALRAAGAGPGGADEIAAGRALAYRTAAVVLVLAAVATPVLAAVLRTPVAASAAAMAMAPLLVLLAGEQGVLQGRERFAALGVVLALAGVGKAVPALAVLAAGSGATGALAASAAGTAAAFVAARLVTAARQATGRATSRAARQDPAARAPAASGPAASVPRSAVGGPAAVLRASQVQLVLIALTSIDLMMARVVLDATDSGVYAMGSVATKAAFWLPAAVGVVLYPRMARPEHSLRAVRSSLAVLTGLGVVVVAAAAAASPLVPLLVGEQYRPVVGLLWLFALIGAAFAVLQGALLSTIARDTTRLAALAWAGLLVEGVALAFGGTVAAMAVTAAACAAGTTAAVTAAVLWSMRAEGARARGARNAAGRPV